MTKARPVLGYASETLAVQAMLAKGRNREEIAEALGKPQKRVGAIIHSAGRRSGMFEAVNVPREILDALKPYADARNVSRHEIARRLLQTIAAERLADVILDDGKAAL